MSSFHRFLAILCIGASSLAGNVDASETTGCTGFRFNLDRELRLFAGSPQSIDAAASQQSAPAVTANTLYAVQLAPQSNVKFAFEPGKITVDDGSFAGVLTFTPKTDGLLRVTLDEAAWLDVAAQGALVQSSNHTGSAGCKLLHKSVQFNVRKNVPLIVQISGSTVAETRMTLTQPPDSSD